MTMVWPIPSKPVALSKKATRSLGESAQQFDPSDAFGAEAGPAILTRGRRSARSSRPITPTTLGAIAAGSDGSSIAA